jgi:beta-glucosidase
VQLRGFKKVIIPASKTEEISIEVAVKDLGLWDIRTKYIVEPGEFVMSVGSSSSYLRGSEPTLPSL